MNNGSETLETPPPRTFLVIGMAGSGKTTFCQRLYSWLNKDIVLKNGLNANITSINLDPAVKNPKMPLTIDIRDTIDFKDTMVKYNLGPNGCTNTCLNLFLLDFQLPEESKYTIVDTPGQIEAFTWSAPGEAIFSLLKNVCICYVIDLSLCTNKFVFMSNMIFAASLKIRFNRPLLIIFNKSDSGDFNEVEKWVKDYDYFISSLSDDESELRSMALYFEDFYNNADMICISALTGAGKEEFFKTTDKLFMEVEHSSKS